MIRNTHARIPRGVLSAYSRQRRGHRRRARRALVLPDADSGVYGYSDEPDRHL